MQYDNKEKVGPSGSKVSIINVMAGSLDGAIASHPNESDDERKAMGFINEADHDHVRELLASYDAVIAGGHSVNVSGGVMEVVNDAGQHPTWILCTRSGFEADAPIWNSPNTAKWLVSDKSLPSAKTSAVRVVAPGTAASLTKNGVPGPPGCVTAACQARPLLPLSNVK